MENNLPERNPNGNEESPSSVFIKIVVTTVATLAVGWLIIYLGLI